MTTSTITDKYYRVNALKRQLENRASDPEAENIEKYQAIAREGRDLVADIQRTDGYHTFSFSDLCWWNSVVFYFS